MAIVKPLGELLTLKTHFISFMCAIDVMSANQFAHSQALILWFWKNFQRLYQLNFQHISAKEVAFPKKYLQLCDVVSKMAWVGNNFLTV